LATFGSIILLFQCFIFPDIDAVVTKVRLMTHTNSVWF